MKWLITILFMLCFSKGFTQSAVSRIPIQSVIREAPHFNSTGARAEIDQKRISVRSSTARQTMHEYQIA